MDGRPALPECMTTQGRKRKAGVLAAVLGVGGWGFRGPPGRAPLAPRARQAGRPSVSAGSEGASGTEKGGRGVKSAGRTGSRARRQARAGRGPEIARGWAESPWWSVDVIVVLGCVC